MKSSGNAFRHGLSRPMQFDPITASTVEAVAQGLVSDQTDEVQLLAPASEAARARLDLLRIRRVRNRMISELDQASCNEGQVRRLAALDRYERLALATSRRASKILQAMQVMT